MHELYIFDQGTLVDQVHHHELAPSTPLTDLEVMEVLGNLFQLDLHDYNQIINHIKTKHRHHVKEQAEPSDIQAVQIASFTTSFLEHISLTLYVKSKEASGYGMLSVFSLFVCKMMQDKYPSSNFRIDPQFRVCEGNKFTSDQGLVHLIEATRVLLRVLALWEYKPRVPGDLDDITAWHISETLLQAYYMRKKHSYPVLHCLTDLTDYHYFFIEDDGERTLTVVKYVYLRSDLCKPNDVWNHIEFLLQSVRIA